MGLQIQPYNNTTQQTPHLSALARQGLVFDSAQVVSATCAPSRSALLSGLYPQQNGVVGFINRHGFKYKAGGRTVVERLHDDAGCRTGLTYKTGVDPEPLAYFDVNPQHDGSARAHLEDPERCRCVRRLPRGAASRAAVLFLVADPRKPHQ